MRGLLKTGAVLTGIAAACFVGVPSVYEAFVGERYDINADGMLENYRADGTSKVFENATVLVGDQEAPIFVVNVPAKSGGGFSGFRIGLGLGSQS